MKNFSCRNKERRNWNRCQQYFNYLSVPLAKTMICGCLGGLDKRPPRQPPRQPPIIWPESFQKKSELRKGKKRNWNHTACISHVFHCTFGASSGTHGERQGASWPFPAVTWFPFLIWTCKYAFRQTTNHLTRWSSAVSNILTVYLSL